MYVGFPPEHACSNHAGVAIDLKGFIELFKFSFFNYLPTYFPPEIKKTYLLIKYKFFILIIIFKLLNLNLTAYRII